MANLKPFHGLLPRVEDAKNIVSLPFDRYHQKDLEHLKEVAKDSYLQVILASETEGQNRRLVFEELLHRKVFERDQTAAFYLYRQHRNGNTYTGIIGCVPALGHQAEAQLKKHEDTLESKESQLCAYLEKLNLNAEPVCLTFVSPKEKKMPVQHLLEREPAYSFELKEFGKHELWRVQDIEEIYSLESYFAEVDAFYIADGHHRMASSFRLAASRKASGNSLGGDQYLLCAVFPEEETRLLPFHRLLKGLPDTHSEGFGELWDGYFFREASEASFPPEPGTLAMFCKNGWFKLRPKKAWETMEIAAERIQKDFLSPVLGIEDPRKDARIGFLGGEVSQGDLEKRVLEGPWQAALALPAVTAQQFRAVADARKHMPPKSTWFEPKLLSGLVMLDLSKPL